MTIHLHIEQLVVRGLPLTATDRAELAAAVEAELSRLLASADGGVPWAELSHQPRIEARPVTYRAGGSAVGLGRAVAERLYEGLQSGRQGGGPHRGVEP
jgi:hypothetical protein